VPRHAHALGTVDVPEGTMRSVRLAGGRYVVLVRVDGVLSALDDLCNHAGCQLSRGRLEGGRVVCPCHLMAFDVRTGALETIPRLCEDQPAYPVEERNGEVFVTLPDPER
jgi:3-phenylpropionate/trans-cinnamate dioxygenase ferredoxin subunit